MTYIQPFFEKPQILLWALRTVILFVVFFLAIIIVYILQVSPFIAEFISQGGYAGIFVLAFINGFNVFFPFVTASLAPALSVAGLNVYIVLLLITIAMTCADAVSFFIGRYASKISGVLENKVLKNVNTLQEKYPKIILAIVFLWSSFSPLPNEVILAPLGFLRYRWAKILPIVFLGNGLFNILVVYGMFELLEMLS